MTVPILEVDSLTKRFPVGGGILTRPEYVHAVESVSFTVNRGETFGLVGESGSGKSTLGRLLIRLLDPTEGSVTFDGIDLTTLSSSGMRSLRSRMQIVQQNPYAAIDPRMKIGDVVAQPLLVHRVVPRGQVKAKVLDLLDQVGLTQRYVGRFPHQLSGGQLQRVAIARAISLEPELLILDEPTSALDVSVQAQILRLLEELRSHHDLTYVFISHDLSVIHYISDVIGVMYLGRIVESGPSDEVFASPSHPYTRALLNAAPEPDFSSRKPLSVLEGTVPSALDPPPGCHFHDRCPIARDVCAEQRPPLVGIGDDRQVACLFPLEIATGPPHGTSTERTTPPTSDQQPSTHEGEADQ
jgi:oligopeptide/dipeptide ABC transporter ATP-binding protein